MNRRSRRTRLGRPAEVAGDFPHAADLELVPSTNRGRSPHRSGMATLAIPGDLRFGIGHRLEDIPPRPDGSWAGSSGRRILPWGKSDDGTTTSASTHRNGIVQRSLANASRQNLPDPDRILVADHDGGLRLGRDFRHHLVRRCPSRTISGTFLASMSACVSVRPSTRNL